MADTTNVAKEVPKEPGTPHKPSVSRRHLLRGAAGAAPVMLTLASRPVLAGTCTSASAFGSANASRPGGGATCSGRTPGYWKNHSGWPSGYKPSMLFNDIFGTAGGYPNKTLQQVLSQGGGGNIALARHIVAALLNAAMGWTPDTVLSIATVKAIWSSYIANGNSYTPTAGVKWNSDQLIKWLLTTMPL